MFWLILVLSLLMALTTAYTLAMQKTTLVVGRIIMDKAPEHPGAGVQDAITPKSQNLRNVLMFALVPTIFGLTTYQYAWYHGLWVVAGCFLVSYIFRFILRLQPGSPRLVTAIARDMARRRQSFLRSGDSLRAEAMGELLDKLEHLSPDDVRREASR